MNWGHSGHKWMQGKGNVAEQCDELTEDQFASTLQESLGDSDGEAEPDLTDWQRRLSEIGRSKRAH